MSKKLKAIHIVPILAFLSFIAGALIFFYSRIPTNAALTGQSNPSVTVTAGGSLTVTPIGMAYGNRNAGTHIPYTEGGGHWVELQVDTSVTNWDVKVAKNHDLTSGGDSIPSADFIYTSVYVSGTPVGPNVYNNLEFGTVGTPSNVTDPVVPASANVLRVDARYDLTIPPGQPGGAYSATHTYTLTVS